MARQIQAVAGRRPDRDRAPASGNARVSQRCVPPPSVWPPARPSGRVRPIPTRQSPGGEAAIHPQFEPLGILVSSPASKVLTPWRSGQHGGSPSRKPRGSLGETACDPWSTCPHRSRLAPVGRRFNESSNVRALHSTTSCAYYVPRQLPLALTKNAFSSGRADVFPSPRIASGLAGMAKSWDSFNNAFSFTGRVFIAISALPQERFV